MQVVHRARPAAADAQVRADDLIRLARLRSGAHTVMLKAAGSTPTGTTQIALAAGEHLTRATVNVAARALRSGWTVSISCADLGQALDVYADVADLQDGKLQLSDLAEGAAA